MDLSIREVVTLTGTSERAMRARIARGSLHGFKRAGQWRVPREALQDDPAERRQAGAKADRIRAVVEAGLARGKQLSVHELVPFRAGLELLRAVEAIEAGSDDLFLFADRRSDLRRWRSEIGHWLDAERSLRLKHPDAPVLPSGAGLHGLGHHITREGRAALPRSARRLGKRVAQALVGASTTDLDRSLASSMGVLRF